MPINHTGPITQSEHDDLWAEAEDSGEVGWRQEDIEKRQSLPQKLGQGEIRDIELHPGLEICIQTQFYWRPLYLDHPFDNTNVLLSNFYMEGACRMINPGIQLEDDREEKAGESCLCYLAGIRTIEHTPAERLHKDISIAIDLDRLSSFGFIDETTSPLLQHLTQAKSLDRFHQSLNQRTPAMEHLLHQILNCPYHGAIKRMYLESKALELLALQFYQLTEAQASRRPSKLCTADIERLQLARDILRQRFDHPPSLLELARQVGLNDYKLKQGFRQLFNTTVFGYVQICRMEKARQLLRECELSIANVAEQVGYASPSRFCHAFKRHMGITPSKYGRQFKF